MENKPASKGITFAIFCALRVDVRNCNLTQDQAQHILSFANDGDKDYARTMALSQPGAVDKAKAGAPSAAPSVKPRVSHVAIWNEAWQAGRVAANACVPVPMGVVERANPLDDSSPVVRDYGVITDGVCGFASVHFPGNTSFGKWAKENGFARKDSYRGGLYAFIGDYRQSLQKKEAHAYAMAAVLCKYGIKAYAQSRMD